MCGICGVIQVEGKPRQVVDDALLASITDAMTHRGPDDRGTFVAPGIAIGARRLSVIDPERGAQPVSSEDGSIWAAQNGEIYNHRALRAQLERRGHRVLSRCDTELIPHLYEDKGMDFTDELVGMFSIALWDGRRRRAVLARDRLGVKPLYWLRHEGLIVFASELKSLLRFDIPTPGLDEYALDAYMTLGFVPAPRTPFQGISKLEPGHRLVVEDGDVRIERWWTYPLPAPDRRPRAEAEYREELLELLQMSVELRLDADVPVGSMLSGGLDSSLVTALASRSLGRKLKTFAVGFEGENELAEARAVARLLDTEHHELELSPRAIAPTLPSLAWHLDEPLADLSAVGFLALSKAASEHVTVALSGQGADELLGGYRKHVAASYAGRFPSFLRPLPRALAGVAPARLRRPLATLGARGPAERLLAMSGLVEPSGLRRVGGSDSALMAVRRIAEPLGDNPLPDSLYLDAQLGLPDDMLQYFDRASMAHSLEVRVPFLDHRVVEFCATLPSSLCVRGRTTKYLLKEAARGVLPDTVIDRPKVGFFNRSVDRWLADQQHTVVGEALLGSAPRYARLLDPAEVRRMFHDHLTGRAGGNGRLLLAVVMLEFWLDAFAAPTVAARDHVLAPAP
jgi:asparagine synthase (glutamine-hydrolysing)